jgi:hypothetical protein
MKSSMTDPIRSFYRSSLPNLLPVTALRFRHFRLLQPHGPFLKVRDRIRNAETLRRWLIRYRPIDVYYSASCWLSPESLGRRGKTPLSSNIFLSSDIVFDIDRESFGIASIESARRDTLRLIQFCQSAGIQVKYIAFSGSKGFHVSCRDPYRYLDQDPYVREEMARSFRREIASQVAEEGITIDTKVTTDTRRIIRVPGTVNSKTGYVCTVLDEKQIGEPAAKILKYIPRLSIAAPPIPVMGDESPLRGPRMTPWLMNRTGVRSEPQSHFSYATFLLSHVPGIQRQVPFFTYPARRSVAGIRDELQGIQEMYGLSDIHMFRADDSISAVCFRTFPLERLKKIVMASSSQNRAAILKYRQLFFRDGEEIGEDQQVRASVPGYFCTLEAGRKGRDFPVSGPHLSFFSDAVPSMEYGRMHGKGQVSLTHVVIER